MTPEQRIEKALVRQAKQAGFLCLKWVSPSIDGVPDRLLIGYGHVVYIEVKAPGETPSLQQFMRLNEIRATDSPVHVLDRSQDIHPLLLYYQTHPRAPVFHRSVYQSDQTLAPTDMKESVLEDNIADIAANYGFLYWKLTCPGTGSVPDRILIGNGYTLFFELKGKNGKLSKNQRLRCRQFKDHQAPVFVVNHLTDAETILCYYHLRKRPIRQYDKLAYKPVDVLTRLEALQAP